MRKNISIAMPLLIHNQGFTEDNFAMVLFFYGLFYALGQFYNGFLSDKFGPRLIVGIGLFLVVLANCSWRCRVISLSGAEMNALHRGSLTSV